MFRPTRPQQSLLESQFLIPAAKRVRLEKSWAHVFRTKALPLIDEEIYRDAFDPANGRPNQSIRLLTGVHILKDWFDLTDEMLLENLEFNLLWHHALGVTSDEAHLARKTLHNHRVRTLASERARKMFERVTLGLIDVDGLSVGRQRLDSTHVISNMMALTRLGLLVETLTGFLSELGRAAPDKLESLGATVKRRYIEREGYFADAKKEQARRRLPVVARDLKRVIDAFTGDEQVQALESFQLVLRVFAEQCDVVASDDDPEEPDDDSDDGLNDGLDDEQDCGPKVRLKEGKEISGQSLQSPHDPDATYGHKGKGFEAQVAETCDAENPYQVITHIEVNGAHESDQLATSRVIGALIAAGMAPTELIADTGYGSGENIVDAAVCGVDLQAPVQDPNAPEKCDTFLQPFAPTRASEDDGERPLGLGDFRFNATFNEAVACPGGHEPRSNEVAEDRREPYLATFASGSCGSCPLLARCPTRQLPGSTDRVLRWRDVRAATAVRQREQRTAAFKENYKIRSGIEATNAELKGMHGARKLRVRRRHRVTLSMLFKAIAVNVKRACQAALRPPKLPAALPAPA